MILSEFLKKYLPGEEIIILKEEILLDIEELFKNADSIKWQSARYCWEITIANMNIYVCCEDLDAYSIIVNDCDVDLHIFLRQNDIKEYNFLYQKNVTFKEFLTQMQLKIYDNFLSYLNYTISIEYKEDIPANNSSPDADDGEIYEKIGSLSFRDIYYKKQWSCHFGGVSQQVIIAYPYGWEIDGLMS